MKNFIFIFCLVLFTSLKAQKAYGPINFGMSMEQIKEAASGAVNITYRGTLITKILGVPYSGLPIVIDNKLEEISFHHRPADSLEFARDFITYQHSDFEREINDLIGFFTEIAGKPTEFRGYIPPLMLDAKRSTVIATWKGEHRVIQLLENNKRTIPYPEIRVISRSFYDLETGLKSTLKDVNRKITKGMF